MPLTQAPPDALAQIYAKSLFELAQEAGGQGKVEETLGELEDILELARSDRQFGEFLSSRILPAQDRARSLQSIFKGRVSDLTLRFLMILNQKDRLANLPMIGAAFDRLVQEEFGRVEVDVYTAAPLGPDELGEIRRRLQSALGKEPIVHPYVDNAMIGGLRLQIGDQLIDASVAAQLRRMRDRLKEQGAARIRAEAGRMID